jgi:hypothetical protein
MPNHTLTIIPRIRRIKETERLGDGENGRLGDLETQIISDLETFRLSDLKIVFPFYISKVGEYSSVNI